MADLLIPDGKKISPINETPFTVKAAIASRDTAAGEAVAWSPVDGRVIATASIGDGVTYRATKAGEPVDVLMSGSVAGYDLTAVAPGTTIYYSANAGALCTDAGAPATPNQPAGRVLTLTDGTKAVFLIPSFVPPAIPAV